RLLDVTNPDRPCERYRSAVASALAVSPSGRHFVVPDEDDRSLVLYELLPDGVRRRGQRAVDGHLKYLAYLDEGRVLGVSTAGKISVWPVGDAEFRDPTETSIPRSTPETYLPLALARD